MGRKRNEIMRGIRGKSIFMTNLATSVYSKSTLMTLLFNAIIVDKQTLISYLQPRCRLQIKKIKERLNNLPKTSELVTLEGYLSRPDIRYQPSL